MLGVHSLTATVSDGEDEAGAVAGFTVLDGSGAGAPDVSLTAPLDGDSVTSPRTVTGQVADVGLASWRLLLADHDGHAPLMLASGTAPIDGTLGTIDPTRLENGLDTLTLRAWNHAGHEARTALELVVEGELKIGHFAVAFDDATTPLGGIPITVTRGFMLKGSGEGQAFGEIRLSDDESRTFSIDLRTGKCVEAERLPD